MTTVTRTTHLVEKGWYKVVKGKKLAVKDIIQVRSFRAKSELYFALVKGSGGDDNGQYYRVEISY
ncbi:DNA-binding pseudobarrel domain containing protein [Trema orientale]|uniref:DNA-binding pseudobarrel domain containing protein n=1 Tax=Trema orientale TaxID=63057 RepID=A0A2P5FIL5_TREOI|nr:DNA-binding pseudobarrel domain containing protein [Trema orientale]